MSVKGAAGLRDVFDRITPDVDHWGPTVKRQTARAFAERKPNRQTAPADTDHGKA